MLSGTALHSGLLGSGSGVGTRPGGGPVMLGEPEGRALRTPVLHRSPWPAGCQGLSPRCLTRFVLDLRCTHMSPQHQKSRQICSHIPTWSPSVLIEYSGDEGEVAGSKSTPRAPCRYLAGTLAQAHVFIRVNFSTRAPKPQLWKLPASAITKLSTLGQPSDLGLEAFSATLTDVDSFFPSW